MKPLQLKSSSTNGAVALPMARVRAWLSLFTSMFVLVMVALWSQPAEAGALWKSARDAAHRKQPLVHSKQATQPAPPPPVIAPGKPHDVVIPRSRYPEAARHIDDAQRQGQPSIVHIDRAGATQRRQQSTGSVDRHRKPSPLHERDEYPPALMREGGPNANVRYIPRSDNRGAGASVGAQVQGLPDGSKLRFVVTD